MRRTLLKLIAAAFIMLIGCKEDDASTNPSKPVDYSQDYFPLSESYRWTYTTNALSDSGKSFVTMQTRIGTYTYPNGNYLSLLGKVDTMSQWFSFLSLKDSGGIVYTLGDNPPEIMFPLFKHSYTNNESTPDTISLGGTTYATVRIDFTINTTDTIHLWFAKGIGFVKEMSNQGQSLFSDNNGAKSVHIETSLTGFTK